MLGLWVPSLFDTLAVKCEIVYRYISEYKKTFLHLNMLLKITCGRSWKDVKRKHIFITSFHLILHSVF